MDTSAAFASVVLVGLRRFERVDCISDSLYEAAAVETGLLS